MLSVPSHTKRRTEAGSVSRRRKLATVIGALSAHNSALIVPSDVSMTTTGFAPPGCVAGAGRSRVATVWS